MRDSENHPEVAPLGNYHICFVVVTRPYEQYHATWPPLSHPETVSLCGTLRFPLSQATLWASAGAILALPRYL